MKILNPSLSCLLAVLAFVPIVLFAAFAVTFRAIHALWGGEDDTRLLSLDDFEEKLAGWE